MNEAHPEPRQEARSQKGVGALEVKLKGSAIPVRAQGDPEIAEETLKIVNERLAEAEARGGRALHTHQIAVLALLDLAQEYVEAKRRVGFQFERVGDAVRRLNDLASGRTVGSEQRCDEEDTR